MIDSKLPAPLDDAANRRWIGVLGLAHATGMSFALRPCPARFSRPQWHADSESII
jgi:hypothetical protein